MDINEFDILYKKLSPTVLRRAFLLLKDKDEAMDCVQSAFLTLWEHRAEVDNPTAFVNTIVSNKVNTYYRSLSSRERFNRLYPIEIEEVDERVPEIGELMVFIDNNLTEAVSRVVRCVFFMKLSYRQH